MWADVWDQLRRELGAGFEYGPECWFCVPHEDVHRLNGRRFSERTGGSGRPVVIASDGHPNPIIFARSASRQSAIYHPAHVHDGERGSCALDMPGWIVHKVPVTVPVGALSEETYSCREPDEGSLLFELERVGAM